MNIALWTGFDPAATRDEQIEALATWLQSLGCDDPDTLTAILDSVRECLAHPDQYPDWTGGIDDLGAVH
jgi:hypothetical protein